MPWPMKTWSKTQIGGAVTRLGARSAGRTSESRIWNLRLELGHHLKPEPVRTTEFAPALSAAPAQAANVLAPMQAYGPVEPAQPWKQGRFSGRDFLRQPDGTLRCPAGQTLIPHEHRREADGSLR